MIKFLVMSDKGNRSSGSNVLFRPCGYVEYPHLRMLIDHLVRQGHSSILELPDYCVLSEYGGYRFRFDEIRPILLADLV